MDITLWGLQEGENIDQAVVFKCSYIPPLMINGEELTTQLHKS